MNNVYPRQFLNSYPNVFAQQNINEQIDNEIERLKQMKNNVNQQPTAINQTFQITPNSGSVIKYVNSIEEVEKELTITDTPFIKNDYSILWIKNAKGEIRTFCLEEIIPRDEKDALIEDLQSQIKDLNNQIKEMKLNEQYYDKSNDEKYYEQQGSKYNESIKNEKPTNVSNVRTSKSKSR